MIPFAETIDSARKYVVSSALERVNWNAELVQGDLQTAVQPLKQAPGEGLFVGGMTLPLALADLGLIDEYELVVHPVVVGHGPTLFAGLGEQHELELVERKEFPVGGGGSAVPDQSSRSLTTSCPAQIEKDRGMSQLLRVQNFFVSMDGFGADDGQSLEAPFGHGPLRW